jgi:hypothetical protein
VAEIVAGVKTKMRSAFLRSSFPAHLLAASCSLFFAWNIAQSAYMKTSLQFVAPLLVVMAVHLTWMLIRSRRLPPGFSSIVYRRSFETCFAMAGSLFLLALVAPVPAEASADEVIGGVLLVLFCGGIVVVVALVLAFIFRTISKAAKAIFKRGGNSGGPENRIFDFGSIALGAVVLIAASLEGLPNSYSFKAANQSAASTFVDAQPAQVWSTMEKATSPQYALPVLLGLFPQPVEVVTDEGTTLGAMRKVKFEGREGIGFLTFQVVERTSTRAEFQVLSDTSPYANWVKYDTLIYEVLLEGDGSRLTVTLEYKRLLAPAWFFTPIVKGAAYLAMSVLAGDVKFRSET